MFRIKNKDGDNGEQVNTQKLSNFKQSDTDSSSPVSPPSETNNQPKEPTILKLRRKGSDFLKKITRSPRKRSIASNNIPIISSPIAKTETEEMEEEEEARLENVLKKLEKIRVDCQHSLSDVHYVDETNYTNTSNALTDVSSMSTFSGSEESIDEFEDHPEILKFMKK
jgi:hypothetical protein